MNERPLDLDTVKAFIRIAELGSFTLAADSLRMTQAAVSLKLKRLEPARFPAGRAHAPPRGAVGARRRFSRTRPGTHGGA